jgi:acetoin utilization protein AcuB
MIVRNWMKPEPVTVTSDTLVSKAKRILVEKNLRALPVVDDGRLRGLLTRINCLRASEWVTRTEDPHEFDYFAHRLKVKDLMVRNPATVEVSDTMETCLLRGQEEKVSQFPVLEDGKVVGLVSASEIFKLAAQVLGVWDHWSGITIGPIAVEPGTLGKIAALAEQAGAVLQSLFTVPMPGEDGAKKAILRFRDADAERLAGIFVKNGYPMLEVCQDAQSCREGGGARLG